MNKYISECFLYYERKYKHLLKVTRNSENQIESISFMDYLMHVDHCNGIQLSLKTNETYLCNGFRLSLFMLRLPFDEEIQGDLYMSEDQKFDFETCVALYSNNIVIFYNENGKYVFYDKMEIMRRHTINQIVRDENS